MNYSQSSLFYAPPLTKLNKLILIFSGLMFLIQSLMSLFFGKDFISSLFSLHFIHFMEGHFYTLLTYPFVSDGLMSFLFNALLIWFIGSDLELSFGSKRYIILILLSTLASGLTYLLFRPLAPLAGLNGLCLAFIVCYGLLFSERMMAFMMIFPMKAKYFTWLLLGIELYMGFFSSAGKASLAHLASMLLAYIFYKITFSGGFGWGNLLNLKRKQEKRKNHLHLVEEPDDNRDKHDSFGSNRAQEEKPSNRYWQ